MDSVELGRLSSSLEKSATQEHVGRSAGVMTVRRSSYSWCFPFGSESQIH